MVVEDQLASLLSECQLVLKQARDEGSVSKLPTNQFRTVLDCCKNLSSSRDPLVPPLLSDLAETYLEILSECSLSLENQLLASTAFCHVLSLIQTPTNIALLFSKNFMSATSDPFQVKLSKGSEVNVSLRRPEVFKVCLCQGLLQLGDVFWTSQHLDWKQLMFAKILPLIETHAFTLTHLTFPAFKCLRLFLVKVNQSNKVSRKMAGSDLLRIARIVLSNWENPLSGVKEQNGLVFQALLDACSDSLAGHTRSDTHEPSRYLDPVTLMELVFTEQSWMTKSKYFMLCALMRKNGVSKVLLSLTNDIISGLLTSLAHQHLVSAGAELYKVCLEDINFEQWQQIFLQPILSVLTSTKKSNEKQNVFNHWMSSTIRRFKPSLQIILENLVECQYSGEEHLVYPVVSCYRLGRKEGYEKMQWPHLSDSLHLRAALKDRNDTVRMQAFAVVCVSCKSATVPTDEEFDLVQSFLVENINCNNSALRHSLLAGFSTFLTRITDVCQHILDKRFLQEASHVENRALTRSMMFLDWLYNFLKSNLEVGTNYQRRYASLEIYKIVLSYLTDESVPTLIHRKTNNKNDRHVVMKHAIRVSKWSFTSESSREMLLYCISDPSDDVREAAATLVVTYFKINDHETTRFAELYKKALGMCSDPLFYYAESGALLVQVLTCLVYKCGGQSALKTFGLTTKDEKVSSSLLSVAQVQGSCLRSDLLKAAAQGAPLHGVLRALDRLVLEPSSPEHNKLSEAERLKLITLLETTVAHLLNVLSSKSETIAEYAPSFSEIGEALENLIVESSLTVEESDKHKLSPSYQLLLNCIWLNLRVCCSLASGLVGSYGVAVLGTAEAWRCAEICLSVLKQCRHKGAIESAGACLGVCVGVLSEAGLVAEVQAALGEVLVSMSERTLSSSTRAAGQVTILHRLAASDSRPTKPLVEVCVSGLVEIVETNRGDVSQALQALTGLVTDSSLTQELAKHYHSLTILALDAISSQLYPIRNGGLTLLGALVPKLVGQRRRHDEDSTGYSRLPYEELYLHSPALMERLVQELSSCEPGRLLAVLTLVSNLTVGVLTCIDRSLVQVYQGLVDSTRNLLNARWCTVRGLAAVADAWLAKPTHLGSLAHQRLWSVSLYLADPSAHRDIVSENQLHGFLLDTKHIVQRFDMEKTGNSALQQQSKQLDLCYKNMDQLSTADFPQISYVCRSVLSQLSNYNASKPANRQIEEVIAAVNRARSTPHSSLGIYSWTDNEISKIVANCPLDNLVPSLYTCLIHCENHELHRPCIDSLSPKISDPDFKNYASEIINILGHYVAIRVDRVDCTQVLEIILEILVHNKNSLTGFSAENLIKALTGDTETYRIVLPSISVTVLCALLGFLDWDYEMATQLSTSLVDYCDSAENDEETRYNTARGLALLAGPALSWDGEDSCQVKARLWSSVVTLLQDEHPNIRIEASKFASRLGENGHKVWNPHVSLEYLFQVSTLSRLLPMKQMVNCLWSNLKCQPVELLRLDSTNGNSVVNPFEVGISNIFAEHVKIVDMSFTSLYDIVTKDSEAIKVLSTYEIFPYLKDLKEHCLKLIKFYGDYLLASGAMLTNDWYIISKKICYMHKIINYANNVLVDKELEHLEKIYHKLVELKI